MSENTGLEARYDVEKINDPEGKHADCRYFVLDPAHDKAAAFALRAYAVHQKHKGNPVLATDLFKWLEDLTGLKELNPDEAV